MRMEIDDGVQFVIEAVARLPAVFSVAGNSAKFHPFTTAAFLGAALARSRKALLAPRLLLTHAHHRAPTNAASIG